MYRHRAYCFQFKQLERASCTAGIDRFFFWFSQRIAQVHASRHIQVRGRSVFENDGRRVRQFLDRTSKILNVVHEKLMWTDVKRIIHVLRPLLFNPRPFFTKRHKRDYCVRFRVNNLHQKQLNAADDRLVCWPALG